MSAQIRPSPHPEGIVFGMPDGEYHADPSLGSTGLKALMKSAADYWWSSWMNDVVDIRDEREPAHFRFGTAFHKLVLEGEAAFASAYAVAPELEAFPGAMKTTDDLRAYLRASGLPVSGSKATLLERVRLHWDGIHHGKVPCPIWEDILVAATAGGRKALLSVHEHRGILLSTRMLKANPALAAWCGTDSAGAKHDEEVPCFSEVSVFWRERVRIANGDTVEVPCKARFDSLGLKSIVDLKTMSNPKGTALGLAIPQQIHAMGYDLQAAHYMTARERAREFVRRGRVLSSSSSVLPPEYWLRAFERLRPLRSGEDPAKTLAWCWVWIFVQTIGAPIAECRMLRWDSDVIGIANRDRDRMLRRFAENAARHGTDMWVHAPPIEELSMSDLPKWRRFRGDTLNDARSDPQQP